MNIFSRIGNFFKKLFGGNKALLEFAVKDGALRLFQRRRQLAEKVLSWTSAVMFDMPTLNFNQLHDRIMKMADGMKLNTEELVLVNTLSSEMIAALNKSILEHGITGELQEMDQLAEILGWVQWAAKQATKEA
jgi:hypothetical protein